MNILEDINKLILANDANVLYKNNCITLSCTIDKPEDSVLKHNNSNITYSDNVLEISLKGLLSDTDVYYNETEFIRNNKEIDCNSLQKDIAILYYKKSKLLFYCKTSEDTTNYFIPNQISYNQFIELLKSKVFADSYDVVSRQLLLYSLDKGVYKIELPILPPILDDSKNFKEQVKLFSIKYASPDFILHFKNQLYNLPIIAEVDRIQYIISVLSELINNADMEYQLFSKKFSFKKLRTELRQEKETYFKSLTEVISKITTQIISVPISISAAVLASYKSEGWLQILILIVFWGYTYFVLKIHGMYLNDVTDLECTLGRDFEIINRESGYNKGEIDLEQKSIQAKIDNIKSIICLFKVSFIVIATILSGYIIWELLNESDAINSVSSHGLLAYFQTLTR
jgi:hypothetical protein